jgi:hypothetical protein
MANTQFGPGSFKGGDSRPDTRNPLPGFYRARVEFNRDPMKIGRIKVRIPQLHGVMEDKSMSVQVSQLPWAHPGDFIAAANDMGQFIVPHVGTYVWVAFEQGDPTKPIYFGGIPSTGGNKKRMNDVGGDIPKDKHPDYMSGHWYAPTDGDAPDDVYDGRQGTQDVTRGVVFKSPKGHTIMYDDTDGQEELTLIDRSGQVIKMYAPVSKNDNTGNYNRRGNKRADKGTQVNKDGYILLQSGNSTIKIENGKITLSADRVDLP